MNPLPALPWSAALPAAALLAAFMAPGLAHAQSSCSSDGLRAPVALMERFISADCASCWTATDTPQPASGAVALDWIVPGAQGEDAALSAAATRDATLRLQALRRTAPQDAASVTRHALPAGALRLRVANGLALNGYIGASIELRQTGALKSPFTAWLALVETLPAGTEDSPVDRNLVRNVLNPAWGGLEGGHGARPLRLIDSRVMNVPAGANPERLRVIGWVEDAHGAVRAIAQSRCVPPR